MFARGLVFFNRHGTKILAVSLFIGLAWPDLAASFRPALAPSVWVMLFISLLRIRWADAVGHVRRPGLVMAAVAGILVAAPMAVWGLAQGLGLPPAVAAALVLMAGAPPITASPAFALIIGLEAPLALVVLVAATVISPFTLPLISVQFLDLNLSMDTTGFMARLAAFFGSALFAAAVVKKAMGARRLGQGAAGMEAMTLLALVIFAVGVMDGVTARFLVQPAHVVAIIAAAFIANAGLQLAGALVFLASGRRSALSLGFCFGNRNMAVLLAVLPAGTAPDTLLFFALGQFPVYMLPALLAPVYRRILKEPPRH